VTATGGRMSQRTARRRVLAAGGRRVGRRMYVSIAGLRKAYGNDFGEAVLAAVHRSKERS
jgi:hypothetical protein